MLRDAKKKYLKAANFVNVYGDKATDSGVIRSEDLGWKPSFQQFLDLFGMSLEAVSVRDKIVMYFEEVGALNYMRLREDGLIHEKKNKETDIMDPLIDCERENNDEHQKTQIVSFGQIDREKNIQGIGRILTISTTGQGSLLEGQFVGNQLNGFGRKLVVSKDNPKYNYMIGNWVDGVFKGYGRTLQDGK